MNHHHQSIGSSPLARGTLSRGYGAQRGNRLIPARAGNTPSLLSPIPAIPAHPRSRGEHLMPVQTGRIILGSSPLARGTLGAVVMNASLMRLIPARAGNTTRPERSTKPRAAHPRSRGEHSLLIIPAVLLAGSSPLARGTPHALDAPAVTIRLIPARAGNTQVDPKYYGALAAHPRSRGEH